MDKNTRIDSSTHGPATVAGVTEEGLKVILPDSLQEDCALVFAVLADDDYEALPLPTEIKAEAAKVIKDAKERSRMVFWSEVKAWLEALGNLLTNEIATIATVLKFSRERTASRIADAYTARDFFLSRYEGGVRL